MIQVFGILIVGTVLWALTCFFIATLRRTIYRPLAADENPSRLRPHEEVQNWRIENGRKWIKRFFISSGLVWLLAIVGLFVSPVVARGTAPTPSLTPTAMPTSTPSLTPMLLPTQTETLLLLTPTPETVEQKIYPTPTGGLTRSASSPKQPDPPAAKSVTVYLTKIVQVQVTRIVYQSVVITATPGPTQTPWIMVVTATPELPVQSPTLTITPTLTETLTPTPSETPTETGTPTP